MGRIPDDYFDDMYTASSDPWALDGRWYETRKYAITMAMLPDERYRHAFEPGCSVGVLTEILTTRCDHVTSLDVAASALDTTRQRLQRAGQLDKVTLRRLSLDSDWPTTEFDLVVLSEVAYYLARETLTDVLAREVPRLGANTTVVAAHWRHPVDDYPLTGDEANAIIAAGPGLSGIAHYADDDVVIDVLVKGSAESVATRGGVPGSERAARAVRSP